VEVIMTPSVRHLILPMILAATAAITAPHPRTPEAQGIAFDVAQPQFAALEFDVASMVVPTLTIAEGSIRVRCDKEGESVVPQSWFDNSASETKIFLCIAGPPDGLDEAGVRLDVTVGWLAGNCQFPATVANPDVEAKSVWGNELGELGYVDSAAAEELYDGGFLEVVVPVGIGRKSHDTGNVAVGQIQVHDVLFRSGGASYSVHVELRKGTEVLLQSAVTTLHVVDSGLSSEVAKAVSELIDNGMGDALILGGAAYASPANHVGRDQNKRVLKALELTPKATPVYEGLAMLNTEHRLANALDFIGEPGLDPVERSSQVLTYLKDVAACQATLDSFSHLPQLQPRRLAWAKKRVALLTEALSK